MSELKQRIPEHPVRIGIVGEYFTVMDEHSNQFLQEKLVHLGASVYRFMNITNCHFRAKEAALRPKIREYVQYNMGPTTTWTVNSALDYAKRGGATGSSTSNPSGVPRRWMRSLCSRISAKTTIFRYFI